jgi:hypothetical protein
MLPPVSTPKEDDYGEIKMQRQKREEDVLCCDHILDTLSDRLYDVYKSMKTAKEIWKYLSINTILKNKVPINF